MGQNSAAQALIHRFTHKQNGETNGEYEPILSFCKKKEGRSVLSVSSYTSSSVGIRLYLATN